MVNAANIISHIHHTAGVSTGVGRSIRECAIEHARMASQRNALKSLRSNPESKPGNKITLPVLLVTCFLCCVAISLYGLAGMFGEKISRGGHSASNEVLEMVIANSVLNVPANLIRFSSQRRAGAHQRLELYMHWPSLSGYQDKLKESFSSANKQSNLLFLSLEPRSMSLDMSGRIGPIYSKFFNGVPSKGTAGLVRQPLKPEGGFIDEDLFYEAGSPYPFAARCVREGSTIATPVCIRDIHIGNDLMLTYRFHIRHLPHWIRIDGEIRNYVNSLLVNGQTTG